MSQSYPPDPPNRRSSTRFDEVIAVVVALATMGTILFWVLNHPSRKLATTPNPTSATTQTATENRNFSQILEESLPDGVSPLSETTPQPTSVSPSPTATTPQPWWVGLGLVPQPPPEQPVEASPQPPVTPVVPQTANVTPAETRCSTQPNGGNLCSTPTQPQTVQSSTPSETTWASPFVAYFMNKNWATGSDQKPFKPDEKITRGEFAAQLQRAFNQKPEETAIQFKDVPQNFWAQSALKEVTESGFLASSVRSPTSDPQGSVG